MDSFKELVSIHKDKMYRFALRLVGDPGEAKDIVQEVFINLWDNRDYLPEINNLEAWCMRLTKNKAIDKMRSKHKRTEELDGHYDLSDNNQNPAEKTVSSDLFDRIKSLIDQLPEKQMMVMQLRDIEGMKYKEIADILEIPLNQVKINLFRARNTIKEQVIKLKLYGSAQ